MTYSQTDADRSGDSSDTTKLDPAEGLRLLKAFMTIADPKTRATAIEFVESLANSHARDVG